MSATHTPLYDGRREKAIPANIHGVSQAHIVTLQQLSPDSSMLHTSPSLPHTYLPPAQSTPHLPVLHGPTASSMVSHRPTVNPIVALLPAHHTPPVAPLACLLLSTPAADEHQELKIQKNVRGTKANFLLIKYFITSLAVKDPNDYSIRRPTVQLHWAQNEERAHLCTIYRYLVRWSEGNLKCCYLRVRSLLHCSRNENRFA